MDVLISLIVAITPPRPEHHLEHLNLYHSYQEWGWELNKMYMDIWGGGRQREESEHRKEPAVWRKPEIQSELQEETDHSLTQWHKENNKVIKKKNQMQKKILL